MPKVKRNRKNEKNIKKQKQNCGFDTQALVELQMEQFPHLSCMQVWYTMC